MKAKKNPEFEKLVKEKYQKMTQKDLSVDILDEKEFGKLSLFIDKKPNFPLISFEFNLHKVWVGSETIK